jgi:tetratricopeptide (TPR) repeat protein
MNSVLVGVRTWPRTLLLALLLGAQSASVLWAADSASVTNSLSRGVALFEQEDFPAARAALQAALQANPKDVNALIYLGRIAFQENRISEAVALLEKATHLAPQHSEAFHWLGRVYGIQARDLGPPLGIGPARRTRRALEKAVASDPNNLEARLDLATFYREAPGIVGGSTKGARTQIEEIRRRDPYLGALAQGDMVLEEKNFAAAEKQYRAAVGLHPDKADAHYRLGLLYQRTRQFEESFQELETTLRLDPNEKRAHFQIGKTADLSGLRLEQGEQALKTYLLSKPFYIMPKLSWTHRRLGNIYLKQGRTEAARQQYLAAVQADPHDKEAAAALKEFEARTRR